MTFRQALNIDCGLRYMFESLNLQTPSGRRMLLDSQMMVCKKEIDFYMRKLNEIYDKDCGEIVKKLMCLKDVASTIKKLDGNCVLSDVELLEIKYLSIISNDILKLIEKERILVVRLPDLQAVTAMLDPDGLKIPSFYVYDSYDEQLRQVRKELRSISLLGTVPDSKQAEYSQLLAKNADLELKVRRSLSESLFKYKDDLLIALNSLSFLDVLIAKAQQIRDFDLCFAVVAEGGETFYCKMFNPYVKSVLKEHNKEFIPVDIEFESVPVTIIGANMGGKSVVLKTLALNQLLSQFGFGVAAKNCCVSIVDNVYLSIGDDQNVNKGLSSFAAEMLSINNIVKAIKAKENVLALVDEPARTTNPVEGTALVEGLLDTVSGLTGSFILTTHYNIGNKNVKRFRVKGLVNGVMDYTLVEAQSGDIPHEAVAIAQSLGVDEQWIENTKLNLNTK